ncbi:MAG: hypothetical protein JST89_04350 [Cyanobacteria bacterium SZAS-4]|nr:hypothetical protein [Cyanobacteria bacterium SZAS-4]
MVLFAIDLIGNMKTVKQWLTVSQEKKSDSYRHRLFVENSSERAQIFPRLQEAVQKAHSDTVEDLRSILDDGLDPLGLGKDDPAHGYPELLHITTLQGYFGEFLAGVLAQEFKPFDIEWHVPAYLFRFHKAAFDQIARINQTGKIATKIPGRLGDDCLAFSRNDDGDVVQYLCCEAKCLKKHNSGTAAKAHEQLSGAELKPIDLRSLIKIIQTRDDDFSKSWCGSLKKLLLSQQLPSSYERIDFLTYISGEPPKKNSTWLSTETHAVEYTGGRKLEAAEIHLVDVVDFVAEIYKKRK